MIEFSNHCPTRSLRIFTLNSGGKQNKEIVTKLTDAMVSIEGENMRPVTLVLIEETRSADWGIGGKTLTTADVRALAAGKS